MMLLPSFQAIARGGGLFLFAMANSAHSVGAQQGGTLYGVIGGPNQNDPAYAGGLVSIDGTTGEATYIGTPIPNTGLTGLVAIDGKLISSTGFGGPVSRLIEIDPTDASLADFICQFPTDVKVGDLAYDTTTSKLYGIGTGSDAFANLILEINQTSCQVISSISGPGFVAIGFNTRGEMYAMEPFNETLYLLDPTDSEVLNISEAPTFIGALGLTVEPTEDGKVFFTTYKDSDMGPSPGSESLYDFDPKTGEFTDMGLPGLDVFIHDLAILEDAVVTTPAPVASTPSPISTSPPESSSSKSSSMSSMSMGKGKGMSSSSSMSSGKGKGKGGKSGKGGSRGFLVN